MSIKKTLKAIISLASASGLVAMLSSNNTATSRQVVTNHKEYKIYPSVHSIEYYNKHFLITPEINLVVEDGIDSAVLERFEETLNLRKIKYKISNKIISGKTNVLIGLKDNKDTFVDDYLKSKNLMRH
ncbi:hypothetical protein ONA24_02835 [Mycoplasmopsis cynos]|uniref:glycoside hydrolase family 20 zincin-like fold domain-containing protein n=1 Tax=Mycoplasmopsis cynos TaxID=171284 RepID=UPI0024C8443C|nr:glycoside hydrolase family 20 zincin-like fold domain-containing protein [Mycoplasmopsis cynos]WAM10190.1 hypothetical protein ONA24_02835 [Mycoplasmopsis cynos]